VNILSVFDGISCGMIALERAGIKVDNYYASEIDKYAIKVSNYNYHKIIQLGDIRNWRGWNLKDIDLIIAGSPCLGFSKGGNLENFGDERSKLIFDFFDILDYYKPDKFFLENVKMKRGWSSVISERLKTQFVEINSSLVSGQHRERYYWTNIIYPTIKDKNIKLSDIILEEVENKYFLSEKELSYMNRSVKGGRTHWDFGHHSDYRKEKSSAIISNFSKGVPYNVLITMDRIRKFHPIEIERLQNIPENYTNCLSDKQRYRTIGNAWTVDIITEFFKKLPLDK
jgi:DNA-cytosine methyltransferase